jgi:hypothetical protein
MCPVVSPSCGPTEGRLLWSYALQFLLRTQVFPVELQDVEGVEIRLTTAVPQRFELALTPFIKAYDLTIEDGTLDVQD